MNGINYPTEEVYANEKGSFRIRERTTERRHQDLVCQSLNKYPTSWNCAETDEINNAMHDGAKMQNLHIYTIDTSSERFGKDKSSCANCTRAYKGRI